MPLSTAQLLLNRYQILRALNQGGMGGVYLALDRSLNTRVAIKESFATDAQANAQFQQEAQILANLSHQNLPRVTNFFIEPNGARYLVMDFVEGENLQDIVNARGWLPPGEILTWFKSIFNAVNYLHTQPQPIIHRDINPRNIIFRSDGKAVLVDFGIAKVLTGTKTTHGLTGYGTPGYAPPEQYSGGTDQRTDVYALGATLYFALTGETPPDAPMRAAGAPLPPPSQLNPQLTPHIERVILTAMNLNAAQRFNSVANLATELYAIAHPIIINTLPARVAVQQAYTSPTSPGRAGLFMIVIGSVIGGALLAATAIGLFSLGSFSGGINSTPTPIQVSGNTVTPSSTTANQGSPTFTPITTVTQATTPAPGTITDPPTPLPPSPTPTGLPTVTPTELPTDTATSTPISFAVLQAIANVSPQSSNRCPTSFLFQGTLRANAAGNVVYRWEFSDGRVLNDTVANFNAAGVIDASPATWDFEGDQEIHDSGWGRLHVLAPNEVLSPQTGFRIDCEVTPPPSPTTRPVVGPRILFTSERNGNNEVYIMNMDGTQAQQLTNHIAKDEDPVPSPTGAQIAFTTDRDGDWEIYMMNADGSNLRNLTLHDGDDYAASWSPDGSQIVFYSTRDNVRQLYVMNADGSNQSRISTPDNGGDTDDWAPVWSPTGNLIAYQGIPHHNSGGDSTADIFLVDPNGGNKRNLTQGSGTDEESPAWSPDGGQILYQLYLNGSYDIWVMNADGSGKRALTSGPGDDEYPAWSRDGRFILFQSNREGDVDLYVMNADGSNIHRVTFGGGEDEYADWMQ